MNIITEIHLSAKALNDEVFHVDGNLRIIVNH